jgi:uncharacterized protein YciI
MLWAISRVYKADAAAGRAAALEAHRNYLQSQKGIIVLSGQTQSDDGTQAVGTLFVVSVSTRAEAEAFINGDPFTQAGLLASKTVTRMRKGMWNPELMEGA